MLLHYANMPTNLLPSDNHLLLTGGWYAVQIRQWDENLTMEARFHHCPIATYWATTPVCFSTVWSPTLGRFRLVEYLWKCSLTFTMSVTHRINSLKVHLLASFSHWITCPEHGSPESQSWKSVVKNLKSQWCSKPETNFWCFCREKADREALSMSREKVQEEKDLVEKVP